MGQVHKLSQAAFDLLNEEYSLLTTTGALI